VGLTGTFVVLILTLSIKNDRENCKAISVAYTLPMRFLVRSRDGYCDIKNEN